MFTREQYMNKEVSHQEYYAQFVTPNVMHFVRNAIGEGPIRDSQDPHFNDIPLERWDKLHPYILSLVGWKISKANGRVGVALCDTVCVAKAAAEMIRDEWHSSKDGPR